MSKMKRPDVEGIKKGAKCGGEIHHQDVIELAEYVKKIEARNAKLEQELGTIMMFLENQGEFPYMGSDW